MRNVTMKEFYEAQAKFTCKHPLINVYTSSMKDNAYHKHYIAEDGAEMWESNRVVTETVEVEIHGIKCKAIVKFWETECWSTDDSKSIYMYQQI